MDEDEDLPELEPLDRRDYIIGEVEHLTGSDWPERIADRLGYANTAALHMALLRWGRPDLAHWFERWVFDGNVRPALVAQIATRKAAA